MLETLDIIILAILSLGTIAYFTKGTLWAKPLPERTFSSLARTNGINKPKKTRNINEKMEQTDKDCVVFYGSQTGTAEDYASRLAKEASSRFGLKSMTADMEDYDAEYLDAFPASKIIFFVMATYGEGEPTDNAVEFYDFILSNDSDYSLGGGADSNPLSQIRYVAFGLGNKTYEQYNAVIRRADAALKKLGAKRIGQAGEGDDGDGTMEEDFLSWKEEMWAALQAEMGLEERETTYEPTIKVEEDLSLTSDDESVYLGEPNASHLQLAKGPYNSHNPFIAPIAESKELMTTKDRNCLHMEIDLSGSGVTYTTGDHVAIWPVNADAEVDRFLRVLGLLEKRHTVISFSSSDSTTKIHVPSPTTYDAACRYYIEICSVVSRQFLGTLAPFAPNDTAKEKATKLGSDKAQFKLEIADRCLNIGQVMELLAPGGTWDVPFSLFIETIPHLQPRYYSISSSSLLQPEKVSITAVVTAETFKGHENILHGVTTNYLLALKNKQNGEDKPKPHGVSYAITGPRNKYDGIHVPVHTRHSTFKLPSDVSKPIILVGPGTGVAPLRGFIMERMQQLSEGQKIGKMILFFGCRKRDEDYIYQDMWEKYEKESNGLFKVYTAFSREGDKKVYVQDRLKENAKEINQLLEEGANFYVCGDAGHMARSVNATLAKIIESERGLGDHKGEEVVKQLKNSNHYQEDVW